jgi:hypothetical protein
MDKCQKPLDKHNFATAFHGIADAKALCQGKISVCQLDILVVLNADLLRTVLSSQSVSQ